MGTKKAEEANMSRNQPRPPAKHHYQLEPQRKVCVACEQAMWVAYHIHRRLMTLQGLCELTIVVRRCRNRACSRDQQPYRPEEEGRWALPHGECGLDVSALVGRLRSREQRSISEIHQQLEARQVLVCERTVEHLLHRYDELVTLHLQHKDHLCSRMQEQGRAILARDGWQPAVGHEVLWVSREVLVFGNRAGASETSLFTRGFGSPAHRS